MAESTGKPAWKRIQEFPYHQEVREDLEPTPYFFLLNNGQVVFARYDFDGCDHNFERDEPPPWVLPVSDISHFMEVPPLPDDVKARLVYHDK